MDIKQKKREEEKFFKSFYPVADDKIRQKTNAELELRTYKFHFYFARFVFAVLSFALYLPTIIELFQSSFTVTDYIRNFIIVLILLLLEIGLSFSLYDYYVRYHSENKNRRKIIVYGLAFVSIVLSALSGVNAIDIVDKSENNIITETRANQAADISKYMAQIDQNTQRITDQNAAIALNNNLIKDLAPIAATKKGSNQIFKYQKANNRSQVFIGKWMNQNNHLYREIADIRKESKTMMKTRITKAGKKELIYMVIFFISGIVAVGGLMYSYNFIGLYYRHVKDDAKNIEVLRKQLELEEEEYQLAKQQKSDLQIEDEIRRQERLNILTDLRDGKNNEANYFVQPEKKKFLQ